MNIYEIEHSKLCEKITVVADSITSAISVFNEYYKDDYDICTKEPISVKLIEYGVLVQPTLNA